MANTVNDTILVEVFGSSPETRIISFFMDFPLNDFMQKEVCEATGLNPRTVSARLSKLKELGIIKDTRKVGKATFYKLNRGNRVVGKIDDLIKTISMDIALQEQVMETEAAETITVSAVEKPPNKLEAR
ncbi:MAG: winged helix-turn-helix domain-containing protein [Candidatus Bathyarchaeota archaeon]